MYKIITKHITSKSIDKGIEIIIRFKKINKMRINRVLKITIESMKKPENIKVKSKNRLKFTKVKVQISLLKESIRRN